VSRIWDLVVQMAMSADYILVLLKQIRPFSDETLEFVMVAWEKFRF